MVLCEWININWHIHALHTSVDSKWAYIRLLYLFTFFFCRSHSSLFTFMLTWMFNVCVYVQIGVVGNNNAWTKRHRNEICLRTTNIVEATKYKEGEKATRKREEPIFCAKRYSVVLWPANNRHRGGAYHIQFVCCCFYLDRTVSFLNEPWSYMNAYMFVVNLAAYLPWSVL